MKEKHNSKGFFFVLLTLLVLIYILGSLSLMTMSIEISERRAAENFKSSNIEAVMDQLTQQKMDKLAFTIVYGALANLNDYSVNHPLKAGDKETKAPGWEFKYVNASMHSLILNGTASKSYFLIADEDMNIGIDGSINAWAKQLNSSLSKVGLRLDKFYIENFIINESGISTLNYSFDLGISIKSNDATMSLARVYHLKGVIDVTGIEDPAIKREAKKQHSTINQNAIQKQLFFHKEYTTPASLQPKVLALKGSAGQGWFYGPLVNVGDAEAINVINRSKYILVGSYEDIAALNTVKVHYLQFGAYLLTNAPTLLDKCGTEDDTFNLIEYKEEGGCTAYQEPAKNIIEKPFVVLPGFSIAQLPQEDESVSCPNGKCALFIAQYDYSSIENDAVKKNGEVLLFGMEKLRDFAACGYYMGNGHAPSYLQRLFNDTYDRTSEYGIETFVMGDFIGGAENAYWPDDFSRLDTELFNDVTGPHIRGMPGCKNKEMCSHDSPVGHFSLGKEGISKYLGTALGQTDVSCVNYLHTKCEQS